MNFTIDRNALLKPLGHIYSVVERRNTIPILSNVLIETNSSKVSFTATDMDMDIVEVTACVVLNREVRGRKRQFPQEDHIQRRTLSFRP